MNKKLKKGLIITTTAAIGVGTVMPTLTVMAASQVTNGWSMENGTWYYYQKGVKVKNTWAKDCVGWCYLSPVDGSWVKEGWVKDSHGWRYINEGYWTQNSMWAKDVSGWQYIGTDGYWVPTVKASATNPIIDADNAVIKAETSKLKADIYAAAALVNAMDDSMHEKAPMVERLSLLK